MKDTRQRRILSLIRAKPIGTQEELRSLLERAGLPATQSSVSRDLEELGVIDGAAIEEIVGTIAGEDTIFIAVNDRKTQRAAIKKVWELFG
ncbi:MAG: hypothetical protein LC770_13260 [Acidobacteria bacterium]|nr:hypothetical protein [Acidobacteriota bacterium]